MKDNYAYPLDLSWSTDEIATVLSFLNQVEKAYEHKVEAEAVLNSYAAFKHIVKSKAQEKQIDRDLATQPTKWSKQPKQKGKD